MKIAMRIIFCSSLILTSLFLRSQITIPNGGFETWDYYNTWSLDPEYWFTPNGQLIVSVVPDSSAYEGELAMRVNVLPGFEGGIAQTAGTGIYADEMPDALCFAVKANVPDEDPNDYVAVQVNAYYNNMITLSNYWYGNSSIEAWQTVELPLIYTNELDIIEIFVIAGYNGELGGGSNETWISVDDLHFCDLNPVIEETCNSGIFPNPGSGSFQLFHCDQPWRGQINIYSIDGKHHGTFFSANGIIEHHLAPGLYILHGTGETGPIRLTYAVE